jgi:hypothetical protein
MAGSALRRRWTPGRAAIAVVCTATILYPNGAMGLKALAGGHVSKGQQLRDALRDQMEVFAREVELGEGVGPEERALLSALLARLVARLPRGSVLGSKHAADAAAATSGAEPAAFLD